MSKFNAYSLPALALLSGFAYVSIMVLEFFGRGFTVFTGLMALAGIVVYYPLLKYAFNDLQLNRTGYMLVMYGGPIGVFYYGLWTMVVSVLPDIGFVLILLSVGWLQYSIRKQLDMKVVKKIA